MRLLTSHYVLADLKVASEPGMRGIADSALVVGAARSADPTPRSSSYAGHSQPSGRPTKSC